MSGESPEELAAWGAELGEKGDQAATALQSRMRAKQAKKEVDALRQQLAAAENDAAAAEDAAGPVDGESPEELAAWTASLGDKGDAAATKMQARQRAKQAKKEVEEVRRKLAEAQTAEDQAMEKAVTDTAAAIEVDPDSPEELAKWTAELGDKGDAAAIKMQSKMRAKQAKKEVDDMRAKLAKAEAEAAAAAPEAGSASGEGESPEELAAWTAQLGDKGDAAATKMQARQRAKQAKREVEEMRKKLADAEVQAEKETAIAQAAQEIDPESPEELAKWTAELGARGDAAAAKMQARQRAKQAKKEVDEIRARIAAAQNEAEKGDAGGGGGAGEVDEESPEALAAWTAELGDKGESAATKMQARQRAKQAKKEVEELRKQLQEANAAEQAAVAQEEAIPSSDESPEALAAWSATLGEAGDAAATRMQAVQRSKKARKEVAQIRQEKVGSTERYPNPAESIPEPSVPELQRILEKSISTGAAFEDPRFPPTHSSLYTCEASLKAGSVSSWQPPSQSACIFPEGKPVSDVKASSISGNKFLTAALTIIATRPDLLSRIFQTDLNVHWRSSGLLVLQFFQGFEWKSVALDTNVPADVSNVELWAPMLEKAFAKNFSSYEAMNTHFEENGMQAFESALVEMSGGCLDRVSEPFDFGKLQSKFLAGSLLTVCTKDHHKNPAGLKLGSPYGILDMCEAQGFQLIRLRNPYGDHSGKWTGTIPFGKKTELRDRLGAHNKNKDGTFWMPFKEFCALFADTLYVCRLFKQDFHQYAIGGSFGDSRGSGPSDPEFCSNPQYKLTISKETTVSISLLQEHGKTDPISIVMYKAKGQQVLWEFPDEDLCAVGTVHGNQVNFEATIDPASLGCSQFMLVPFQATPKPEANKAFCLRLFADNDISCESAPKLFKYTFPIEFSQANSGGKRQKTVAVSEDGAPLPVGGQATAGGAGASSGAGGAAAGAGGAGATGGAMGGPTTQVVDNPAWGKNPQMVFGFKKQTTVKVVIERVAGRKKPVGEIGATVCRLVPSSQPDTSLTRVKKGLLPDESANSKAMNELDTKFLKRKLQILPNDWCKECAYVEDRSAVLCQTTPVQGPLMVIPSLSEEGIVGNAQLILYTDKDMYKHARLQDSAHPLICSEWTPDTAGGCHIYYPPYEPQKNATWGRNPQLFLKLAAPSRNVTISLGRCEKSWRQKIAKAAVGCMLGFYVMRQVLDQHKQVVISRDLVVQETTFSASHEIALNIPMDAGCYTILLCTYDPGMYGEFMVYCTTLDDAPIELSSRPFLED